MAVWRWDADAAGSDNQQPDPRLPLFQQLLHLGVGGAEVGGGAQQGGDGRVGGSDVRAQPADLPRSRPRAASAAGNTETGLAAADRLIAAADGVTTWESEARRSRAEFLQRRGAPLDKIVDELEQAADVARRQHAGLFELRALTAALRLADTAAAEGDGSKADPDAARARLARVLDDLAEATALPDFAEAAELLSR